MRTTKFLKKDKIVKGKTFVRGMYHVPKGFDKFRGNSFPRIFFLFSGGCWILCGWPAAGGLQWKWGFNRGEKLHRVMCPRALVSCLKHLYTGLALGSRATVLTVACGLYTRPRGVYILFGFPHLIYVCVCALCFTCS